MPSTASTFVITREDSDLVSDSFTLLTEGLQVGRRPTCELHLNHPAVSPLHAGLTEINDRFYIFNFGSGGTMLNGRAVETHTSEALADGDVVRIGPFSLLCSQPRLGQLDIRVTLTIAPPNGEWDTVEPARREAAAEPEDEDVTQALEVYWQKRRREEGKFKPHSPLRPRREKRLGIARFNWKPTSDLIPAWPVGIIPWALLVVLVLGLGALLFSTSFFMAPIPGGGQGGHLPHSLLDALAPLGLWSRELAGALLLAFVAVLAVLALNSARSAAGLRRILSEPPAEEKSEQRQPELLTEEQRLIYDPDGPDYPHPVIIKDRCIGCHACVDACPHDVLAIVNGVAAAVAPDQCMEDTSCQVECPVNPKACIVVNTTKKIHPRRVPRRDGRFMTDVPGCYIVGDVSGVPLIKNAVNEGVGAVHDIASRLARGGRAAAPQADHDVVIVGAGPAGLSAAITARQLGLAYVVLEQDTLLATLAAYPPGKHVFLKPEAMRMYGGLAVGGNGISREDLLETWTRAVGESGLVINENESCRSVKKADGGDYFVVMAEKTVENAAGVASKEEVSYKTHHVVLALGNRGTPMRLRVPGEEIQVVRDGVLTGKVKYRLADPEAYRRKRIVVVGAGNTAVEAAVDLVARRLGNYIFFRPDDEINEVTLIIRSDLKNDLKFRNKQQVYDCIDEGKVKVYFGTALKEIRDEEVVLMNARTEEVRVTIPNDFVFVLIGGDRPTKFLESIGVKIG